MLAGVARRALAMLLVAAAAGGCALFRGPAEQRTTDGVTAEEMFTVRVFRQNGREPNFEERSTWADRLDQRISDYLRQHPEAANSLEVAKFRALHQVSVGMSKELVEILLGAPAGVARDPEQMKKIARKYWPDVQEAKATEAWVYPLGWNLYFAGDRLVDMTQLVR